MFFLGLYILSLSSADAVLLIFELLFWTNMKTYASGRILNLTFKDTNDFACKTIQFFRFFPRLWSAWTTVEITTERLIALKYPLKIALISTPKKAKITIFFTILISMALGSYAIFTRKAGKNLCATSHSESNEKIAELLTIIIMEIFGILIPIILVAICGGLIIYEVIKMRRFHAEQQNQQGEGNQRRKDTRERQLTYMQVRYGPIIPNGFKILTPVRIFQTPPTYPQILTS